MENPINSDYIETVSDTEIIFRPSQEEESTSARSLVEDARTIELNRAADKTFLLEQENATRSIELLNDGVRTGEISPSERDIALAVLIADGRSNSLIDSKTGLPNDLAFKAQAERLFNAAKKDGSRMCVAFIDLDEFKTLNASITHQKADEFLNATASVLRTSAQRPNDYSARIGGDEFAQLLDTDMAGSVQLLELLRLGSPTLISGRARTALNEPTLAHSRISLSIGVAEADFSSGQYPNSVEELIAQANLAVLGAKALGKDRVVRMNKDGTLTDTRKNTNHRVKSEIGPNNQPQYRFTQIK